MSLGPSLFKLTNNIWKYNHDDYMLMADFEYGQPILKVLRMEEELDFTAEDDARLEAGEDIITIEEEKLLLFKGYFNDKYTFYEDYRKFVLDFSKAYPNLHKLPLMSENNFKKSFNELYKNNTKNVLLLL